IQYPDVVNNLELNAYYCQKLFFRIKNFSIIMSVSKVLFILNYFPTRRSSDLVQASRARRASSSTTTRWHWVVWWPTMCSATSNQIGRASCRERVLILDVALCFKKQHII